MRRFNLPLIAAIVVAMALPAAAATRIDGRGTAGDETRELWVPNPLLAYGSSPSGKDLAAWEERMATVGAERADEVARRAPRTVDVAESEPNDTTATADPVPGFGVDADRRAVVTGSSSGTSSVLPVPAEDDGDIGAATATGLLLGNRVQVLGAFVGDGPHGAGGTNNGDVDIYEVAMLSGQTLTAGTSATDVGLDTTLVVYDAAGNTLLINDDGGVGLDSFLTFVAPGNGNYYVQVAAFAQFDLADPFDSASGSGTNSTGDYDLTLTLGPPSTDVFRVDLDAGDVLGASLAVPGGLVEILAPDESTVMMGSDQDLSGIYPASSPLGGADSHAAVVATTSGTHYVRVTLRPGSSYGLTLQAEPRGNLRLREDESEIVFLDFDGANIPSDLFGPGSPGSTLSPLSDFLVDFGLSPSAEDDVIDAVIASVTESLRTDLQAAANGDHASSGTPGQFDVTIRNSRDHADQFGQPGVSRVVIGGSISEFGIPTIGLAQSVDTGNYAPNETAVVLLDLLLASACAGVGGPQLACYRGPGTDDVELAGTGIGNIVTHEIGHFIGNWHTDSLNATSSLMDEGGDLSGAIGAGTDDVFGNSDDIDVDLTIDTFSAFEGIGGVENTRDNSAFALSTGTATTNLVPQPGDDVVEFLLAPFTQNAPGVLGNDVDPEFDDVTATITSTRGGDVDLAQDGSFTHVPTTLSDNGFSYTLRDRNGTSAAADVDIAFRCGDASGTVGNGGFEADATDEVFPQLLPQWCADNTSAFIPWSVAEAGDGDFFGDGFFLVDPTEGTSAAFIDWPFGPGPITLSTLVEIPQLAQGSSFSFDWRAGWIRDVACGDCADDIDFDVVVADAVTGSVLDRTTIFAMPVDDDTLDTGAQTAQIDLGDRPGELLELRFEFIVPDTVDFPGFGQIQLDAVELEHALPPVTAPDTYAAPQGDSLTVAVADGLLTNDATVGSGPLTAALADGPVNGEVTLRPDGSFTYTHDGSATTTDTFTYTATDADAVSAAETVTIAIGEDQVIRLAGENRISTAVAISRSSRPSATSRATGQQAPAVVLARADNFADGLAGTPFAASVDAPVLLTFPGELHPETNAELRRVLTAGGTVHLLGGEVALSAAVADAVRSLGFTVNRIAGPTRYDTSVAIAEELGDVDTILVARGDAFPDALAAGPAAIAANASIVLTTPETASPITQAYLDDNAGADVFATGGPAARAFPSATPLSGATRHETAVLIAEEFFDDPVVAAVAVSSNFADALSGGVHIGTLGGPVLLTPTDGLDPAVAAYLDAGSSDLRLGYVYGGPVAIADAVVSQVRDRIR